MSILDQLGKQLHQLKGLQMDTPGYLTNYTDPETGSNYPIAYLVAAPIVYWVNNYISFQTNIYATQAAYESGLNPVKTINEVVDYGSLNWISYFETTVLDLLNKNILDQSLAYLKTIYPEN